MSSVKRLMDARSARREIDRRLKQFADEAPQEIVTQMETSAEEICGTMRRLVPVLKGRLKRSIGWGRELPEGAGISARGKFGKFVLYVFAGSREAFWAKWIEFGTHPHSLAKGARLDKNRKQHVGTHHGGTRAQPFFWPAWRAHRAGVKKAMRSAYKAVGKRVFGNAT